MKYHLTFFITVHCFLAATCSAMEKQIGTPAKILMELNVIQHPDQVICFPDGIAAIAGRGGCSICNFSTNNELIKLPVDSLTLDGQFMSALACKQLLAINNVNTLIIYEVPTGNKISEQNSENYYGTLPIFNPADDTFLTLTKDYKPHLFNYKNNTHKTYDSETYDVPTTFHPTKQKHILCSNDFTEITLKQFDEDSFTTKKTFAKKTNILNCKYNPDGSLIGFCDKYKGFFLLDPETGLQLSLAGYPLCAIVFHRSSFIAATFSLSNPEGGPGTIHYWNTKNKKLITTTPLEDIFKLKDYAPQRMDFSYDGTKLIVALLNKCIVLEMPFVALYQPNTKDRCSFANLVLQHYLHQNEALPLDIRHILIKHLLAASRYSLTNY